MRARLARLARLIGVLIVILLVALVIPLVGIGVMCRPFAKVQPETRDPSNPLVAASAALPDASRPEDQTYLTLPEWYIVYSADEYAAFIQAHPPSQFPFFRAIGQYWHSYWEVCGVTRNRYPFNVDYHLTLYVIGTSFTFENALHGLYENTMGRAVEWLSSDQPTAEDLYGRQVAQEYGTFIHTIPWYEFPFEDKLRTLWSAIPRSGPDPVRKWERRFALSLEYGGKALYSRLIKGGTQAAYEPELLEVLAVAEDVTPKVVADNPELRVVQTIDERMTLISIPRYEAFTQLVPQLTKQGVRFVEIAGNDEIMLTAFVPEGWVYGFEEGEYLFAMPILTQPGQERVAIKVPVASLHEVLAELERRGVGLEHLYDY